MLVWIVWEYGHSGSWIVGCYEDMTEAYAARDAAQKESDECESYGLPYTVVRIDAQTLKGKMK